MLIVRRWTCDHPFAARKKTADAVRDELQTPASRENIVKLLARREKPANALGRGAKLFIHPAEAPENNSIARVCHEAQDLALGEKLSSAPTRRKYGCGAAMLANCNSRLRAANLSPDR